MLIMAGKRGRPPKPISVENEKKCMEYYEDFKSAAYAASRLGLNRRTVELYYQKFAATELVETNESFIARQTAVKNTALKKMDELIEKAKAQIERVELSDSDYSPEGINMERLLQKSITDLNDLYHKKADMEMTPTLNVHINAEIEKRFGHLNEPTKETKPTSNKSDK